jgi:DDE superfamily endonuclease
MTLTMTECVNAEGSAISPMVIIEGAALLERYFTDLPDQYLVARSSSGYTNDELSLEWAKYFVRESQKLLKGIYRLLLFDGFNSYCTQEFLEVLEDNKVIAYRLPPHTLYFLQPLDVGCFQPYKHWHAQAVDYATCIGCTLFNKVEFLAAIGSI